MIFRPIVESAVPVTLVGGGEATASDLHEVLTLAPTCVAVDGGAALAVQTGVDIAAVIGDFDSIAEDTLARIPKDRQHLITEQTHTDFEKALLRIVAPALLCVGFTGGRTDHLLAAFHALVAFPHQPCILIARNEVIFLAPPTITLPTCQGDVVSLFPMARTTGQSSGLEWPIDELALEPGVRIGTSNRATGPVTVKADAPHLLMILPGRLLNDVMQQFAVPGRALWPAPER